MPGWYVPSMINMWTKYGESRFYGNVKTDLNTETWWGITHKSQLPQKQAKCNNKIFVKSEVRNLENQKVPFQPWWPSWIIDRVNRHNFGRGPTKNYLDQIWSHSMQWFWRKIWFSKIYNFSTNQKPWQSSWM